MYNGEERRKTMDKQLQEMEIQLASFTATVTEWMESTKQYRRDLCVKQDKLLDKQDSFEGKLSELPCRERKGIYDSIKGQLTVIWVVITGVVSLLFLELFKR